jgi:CBS domain-containing protein
MNTRIIYTKKDTPVYAAMGKIAAKDISGMPVVEDDMKLVGILSEKDLLQLLYERDGESKRVQDFMTEPPLFFDENESLLEVCDFLRKNVFRRVPITRSGKLVGLISITDVLNYILDLRAEERKVAT